MRASSPRAYSSSRAPARGLVGQGDLDGEVDPARPRRERGLEGVRPVGGEHERHVGVLAEPAHLVHQLEEHGPAAAEGAEPLLGDEVDVLQHHHRRGQAAREPAERAHHAEARSRQQDDRRLRQQAGEVADRERLAGPRRPPQQQPARQVAPAGEQGVPVARGPGHVALDPVERAIGQNQLGAVHAGPLQEGEPALAAAGDLDGHHLAAVDVEALHLGHQVRQQGGGGPLRRRHRLGREAGDRPVLLAPPHERHAGPAGPESRTTAKSRQASDSFGPTGALTNSGGPTR